MSIRLNHTIVPTRDNVGAATWFADIFGLVYEGDQGHFAPVRVNDDLTLDFDTRQEFESHHYAFLVDDDTFDAIFERIKNARISYGSGPRTLEDGKFNHRKGGRGVYFRDPDGHILELMTKA